MTNENASQITANNASTPNNPQVTGKIQRNTACIISWIAVVAMLALIFFMSSRSGIDIDNNTGIFSAVKQWLSAQAAALFGHEVDVSPVGHFSEYLMLGAVQRAALPLEAARTRRRATSCQTHRRAVEVGAHRRRSTVEPVRRHR